jgi:uncharacterized LabA/DUF88 family protein
MKTNVYIDALNLYYGCLRGTPYRWLDLRKLCEYEFPNADIVRIRVFTAPVKPRQHDPDVNKRQSVYIKALNTVRGVVFTEGNFRNDKRWTPLVTPLPVPTDPLAAGYYVLPQSQHATAQPGLPIITLRDDGVQLVYVHKTEEKGSDVNLATHLLVDAFEKSMDEAIVVTNDVDLVEAVRLTKEKANVPVHVLNPCSHAHQTSPKPNRKLQQAATTAKLVSLQALQNSLLPNPVVGPKGTCYYKPKSW